MPRTCRLTVVSDIHYASAAERARGSDYEAVVIPNRLLRFVVHNYRRFIWLHRPLDKGYLLDRFLEQAGEPDYVIANGDYSCDSSFVGVSDDAALQSTREALSKLRKKFGGRLV